MENNKVHEVAKAFALLNAVEHGGKANPGAVVGRVISFLPGARERIKETGRIIKEAVDEVNRMGADEQKELIKRYEELINKAPKREKKGMFDFMGIKEGERVVTAFPPEPSKYPHLGHAKAILLNYTLAKSYNGEFILRFEDTNPALAREEFYKVHLEEYSWLGIKADRVSYASDFMEKFYEYAEQLINEGLAYVCSCPRERIKMLREKGEACSCRGRSTDENIELWGKMKKEAEEGSLVLRLKIDMKHPNSTMRDPAIMRIISKPHPRKGDKYRVWPAYDFENSVMDGVQGVTHRLRSKEFEMRNELQRHIQGILHLPLTNIYEFARFNLEGVESSGRKIRELIEEGRLRGWDDPRLTTLAALKRRGFLPEAIRNFLLSTGITKSESVLTWNDLIAYNRRLLDEEARRFFFVRDPVRIEIEGAEERVIHLRMHPTKELGERTIRVSSSFYVERADFSSFKEGKLYRLMHCLNFVVKEGRFVFHSTDYEPYREKGTAIMHWLPVNGVVKAGVMMDDAEVIKGIAEEGIRKLEEGSIIQFERFGFCRLDNKKDMLFWFTHK